MSLVGFQLRGKLFKLGEPLPLIEVAERAQPKFQEKRVDRPAGDGPRQVKQEMTSLSPGQAGPTEYTEYPHDAPGDYPKYHKQEIRATGSKMDGPTPPPVCIPADVAGITFDPPNEGEANPYDLGEIITVDAFLASGTNLNYKVFVNGVMVATDVPYEYTAAQEDLVSIDPATGIGQVFIWIVVWNSCNEEGVSTGELISIFVQGEFPPP